MQHMSNKVKRLGGTVLDVALDVQCTKVETNVNCCAACYDSPCSEVCCDSKLTSKSVDTVCPLIE